MALSLTTVTGSRRRSPAVCWLTHVYKHFPDPKPRYVADWEQLPEWQKETDADIFEHISHEISQPDTGSVE